MRKVQDYAQPMRREVQIRNAPADLPARLRAGRSAGAPSVLAARTFPAERHGQRTRSLD